MQLSYEELKEWFWKSDYPNYVEFLEYQERKNPNLIGVLQVHPKGFLALTLTMRDRVTYRLHSETNLPRVLVSQFDT